MAEPKKALKIALDGTLFLEKEKTGVSFMAENVARAMIESNPQSQFIINVFDSRNNINDYMPLSKYENVTIKQTKIIKSGRYKILSTFLPIPYRWLFGKKSDITQFFNFIIFPGASGKRVTVVHDMAYKYLPETVQEKTRRYLELNMGKTIKRADIIIAVSQFTKNEILRTFEIDENKIKVIPCIINKEVYNTNYSEDQVETAKSEYNISGPYFLYLGTLEPRKNIVKQIEAYALLKEKNKDLPKFVLAGKKGWMYDEIFTKVKQLGLENDIIFTGYVESSDAPLLMKGALAFLYVSLYEGFGMPPLEAMSCGTPVIVSKAASLPEVVGDAGIMVDPDSADEIAEAMEKIASSEEYRRELSQKSLERSEYFSVEKTAKEFYEVYEELLK